MTDGGMYLDKNNVEFLAARLRRLCVKFGYPVPDAPDEFIVGVGASLIGALLTNLEVAERNKK